MIRLPVMTLRRISGSSELSESLLLSRCSYEKQEKLSVSQSCSEITYGVLDNTRPRDKKIGYAYINQAITVGQHGMYYSGIHASRI